MVLSPLLFVRSIEEDTVFEEISSDETCSDFPSTDSSLSDDEEDGTSIPHPCYVLAHAWIISYPKNGKKPTLSFPLSLVSLRLDTNLRIITAVDKLNKSILGKFEKYDI